MPCGAVAAKLNRHGADFHPEKISGEVFCFLPLSLKSRLIILKSFIIKFSLQNLRFHTADVGIELLLHNRSTDCKLDSRFCILSYFVLI